MIIDNIKLANMNLATDLFTAQTIDSKLEKVTESAMCSNSLLMAESVKIGYFRHGSHSSWSGKKYYAKIPVNKDDKYIFNIKPDYINLMDPVTNKLIQEVEYPSDNSITLEADGYLYVTFLAENFNNARMTKAGLITSKDYVDNSLYTDSALKQHGYTITAQAGKDARIPLNKIQYSDGDILLIKCLGKYKFTDDAINPQIQFYDGNYHGISAINNNKPIVTVLAETSKTYHVYINNITNDILSYNILVVNLSQNTYASEFLEIYKMLLGHNTLVDKNIAILSDSYLIGISELLEKKYFCKCFDYAVSSSRMIKDSEKAESFLSRYSSMDDSADVILVMGGINDCADLADASRLELGDIDSPMDDTTFYGGLKLLISNLALKYQSKLILGVLPPAFTSSSGIYFTYIDQIRKAERDVYEMYGIPIYDLKQECMQMSPFIQFNPPYRNMDDNLLHPTAIGKHIMRDSLASAMTRYIKP